MTSMSTPTGPQPVFQPQWRQTLISRILLAACVIAPVAIVPALLDAFPNNQWLLAGLYIGIYVLILAVTIFPVPYRFKVGVLLMALFALGVAGLFENGLRGAARTYFYAFITLTLVLVDLRSSVMATVLSILSLIGVSALFTLGVLSPLDADAITPDWLEIADTTATFALLIIPVQVGLNLFQREYAETQVRERQTSAELLAEREQLEQRVAERTRIIERRTRQVATGAEIARAASTELNSELLLQYVVDLIQNRLELYYAGVFLSDSNNRFAELKAGTGEAGKTLVSRNHRLEIGGQSMIGRAMVDRKARIALDVGQEAVRFNNPVLPLTRSEMALPLIAREKIVGALTIQSEQSEAFSPEDVVSLQGMADLIAVALDNARLYRETQQALEEVSSVHRSYLSQAWETFARNRMDDESQAPTYQYGDKTFKRGEVVNLPEIDRAMSEHSPVLVNNEQGSSITIPLRLRDQVIGVISVESESADRQWTPDELSLLEAVVEQTALSLENARLIEETESALAESRRLAGRERTVNTISSKIRRLPSVESVLTTALVEVGRVLGANKGQVRLGTLTRRTTLPEAKNE
jgi:GAF domain-containing protein